MEYHVQPGIAPDSATLEQRLAAMGIVLVEQYCSNGARIYPEFGIEYAAPECAGPAEATDFDFDGIRIIRQVTNSKAPLPPGQKRPKQDEAEERQGGVKQFPVLRHAGSFNPNTNTIVTRGYHQNFLTPYPESDRKLALLKAVVGSFLATRIIWDGSGFATNQGYLLSQKATGIGAAVVTGYGDRTKHGSKPLAGFLGSGGSAADKITPGWALIEVRCADPHMSKTQGETSLAAVSLAMRLVERGIINGNNADDYILGNPVAALHLINKNFGRPSLDLASGKFETALGLQQRYLAAMHDMVEIGDIPEDELIAIPRLDTIFEHMGGLALHEGASLGPLVKDVEQAAKFYYLTKKFGENACRDRLKLAAAFDMQWHRIDDRSVGLTVYNNLDPKNLDPSNGKSAPADTRAAARGKAIASGKVHKVGWNVAAMTDGNIHEFIDYWDPELHELPAAA